MIRSNYRNSLRNLGTFNRFQCAASKEKKFAVFLKNIERSHTWIIPIFLSSATQTVIDHKWLVSRACIHFRGVSNFQGPRKRLEATRYHHHAWPRWRNMNFMILVGHIDASATIIYYSVLDLRKGFWTISRYKHHGVLYVPRIQRFEWFSKARACPPTWRD